jgi:hypothetical protein
MITYTLTEDEAEALAMDTPTEFGGPPFWTRERWDELKPARESAQAKLFRGLPHGAAQRVGYVGPGDSVVLYEGKEYEIVDIVGDKAVTDSANFSREFLRSYGYTLK